MSGQKVPRWVAIALPTFLVVGAVGCLVFYWPWITREHVESWSAPLPDSLEAPDDSVARAAFEERFRGHPERVIVERFGPPGSSHNGLHDPSLALGRKYPDAFTATYERPTGRLRLSYCRQRGRLICFDAEWLPAVPGAH